MIHFRRLLTTQVLLILVLFAASSSASSQVKSLVIAVEDDASPWSRPDGSGYANDVVKAAFKAAGVEVELRVVPYARCKRMALRGEVAGCFSMSPSPEFNSLIELSANPIFSCYAGYFYNNDKPPRVKRQEDLPHGTVVGTVIGYEYPPEIERLAQNGTIVIEQSPSEALNLKKLALGRVDLALLTYNETKSPQLLIGRAGVAGKVSITPLRAGTLKSYIGFSLKHPDGPSAAREFNRGLRQITRDGTMLRIRSSWSRTIAREQPTGRRFLVKS